MSWIICWSVFILFDMKQLFHCCIKFLDIIIWILLLVLFFSDGKDIAILQDQTVEIR
jgi:hypothetical protein